MSVRQLSLYYTDDEPSYVRELCPNRKKSRHVSFFFIFFLRHAGFTLLDLSIFPLKMAIFTENLSIFPVLFFFPLTPAGREILF